MAFTHYVKAPGMQPVGCHTLAKAERLAARHADRDGDVQIMTQAEFAAWQRDLAKSAKPGFVL